MVPPMGFSYSARQSSLGADENLSFKKGSHFGPMSWAGLVHWLSPNILHDEHEGLRSL